MWLGDAGLSRWVGSPVLDHDGEQNETDNLNRWLFSEFVFS